MRRWLNRDMRFSIYPVEWGFDERDYKAHVRDTPRPFFFQNRLVAVAPGRRNQRTFIC